MSVYVDKLPDSCYDCCCNNDDWECRLTGSGLPEKWGVRNEDCPLKVLVHCEDCSKFQYDLSRNLWYCGAWGGLGGAEEDDYCSYGERKR